MTRIDLRIDELVLHGFAPGERYEVGATVERELVRLLSTRDTASFGEGGRDVHRLDAGSFDVASRGSLGEGIARVVHASLTPPAGPAAREASVIRRQVQTQEKPPKKDPCMPWESNPWNLSAFAALHHVRTKLPNESDVIKDVECKFEPLDCRITELPCCEVYFRGDLMCHVQLMKNRRVSVIGHRDGGPVGPTCIYEYTCTGPGPHQIAFKEVSCV